MATSNKSLKRIVAICPNPSIDILANISTIEANSSNRINSERRYPGGKGVHVALALAEMEIPTTLIGYWGSENGAWLKEACKKYQPSLEILGPNIKGWNRSCYTFQSNSDWQDTEILGTGPKMNPTHFDQLIALLKSIKDETALIVIAGSWPQDAMPNYTQKLVEYGQANKLPVFLDCSGEQLKNALSIKPFCVHLNRHEVMEYFQEDFDHAKDKMKEYCQVAAITDGSKGLYLLNETESIHANVKIENVINTVGSGDCLMAGILSAYYKNLSFQEVAKKGVACGAANCLEPQLGMLNKRVVEHLVSKVIISKSN